MSDLQLREFAADAERLVRLPDRSVLERRGQAVRSRRRAAGAVVVLAALVVAMATLRAIPDRHEEPVRPLPVNKPYPGNHMRDLPAGTYELHPSSVPGEPTALITVPQGWNTWEGPNRFDGHRPGESNEQALERNTWYVGTLVVKVLAATSELCETSLSSKDYFEASYRATVRALSRLGGYRVVQAPEAVTVFGFQATHVAYRMMTTQAKCGFEANVFATSNNGSFSGVERLELWVVDVGGVPLTVMASSGGDVPPRFEAELDAVVDSIEFVVHEK